MHKFYLMAFPLVMMVCLFCGCARVDAQAMCEFDCDSVINLKLGTADPMDAVSCAPLTTNTDMENIAITYDRTVIDYQASSGRVQALRAGTTKIKSTVNGVTKSVQINVTESIYCNDLRVKDFVMEAGKTADLFATNRSYIVANSGYNMGYTFESLTPEILTIDASGVITANKGGQGVIKIVAKIGVNPNAPTGYDTVFKTINVTVIERRAELNLAILDKNLEEVSYIRDENGIKNYVLYSTANGGLNYFLKISSDQVLSHCVFTEHTTENDCMNVIPNSGHKKLVQQGAYTMLKDQDPNVVYQGFRVVDCGFDAIEKLVIDSGSNFYYQFLSERVLIAVYKLATEADIDARVLNEYSDVYTNVDLNNNYCLYSDTYGNATSAVYVEPIISQYCNCMWTFESDNLTVEVVGNRLKVSCGKKSGVGTLTIRALDGGNACKTIGFYTYKKAITITTELKTDNVIYLRDGVAHFSADYIVRDEDGYVLQNQEVYFVFVGEDNQPVTLGRDKVIYYDATYPNLVINFVATGKYTLLLFSQDGRYYSDVIFIFVYDENSLTK